MKEFTEINIKIHLEDESESEIAAKIEREALKMQQEGWFYLHSHCDALIENLTLFFERELEVE